MKAVHEFIKRHNLLRPRQTVIVAVSGGPDSMALLHYLWKSKEHYLIDVKACHLNHLLRGKEAEEDVAYVRKFCEQRDIDLYEKKVDVGAYAKQQKIGTQLAARIVRYEWFEELLQHVENGSIATAHHGDDQVETMMMKTIRGTLPLYSYGIPVKRNVENGTIIRPFLAITKAEIESYCKKHRLFPRYDSSNKSMAYTRNRIRQQLLPILKMENENIHIHMQRQNEWQSDDQQFLMEQAKAIFPTIIKEKSDQFVTICRTKFLQVALPLQRRLVHLILNYLCEDLSLITSIHIEQVLLLLHRENPSAQYQLAESILVRRAYDDCHFFVQKNDECIERETIVSVPGITTFNEWTIHTSITDELIVEEDGMIVLDAEKVAYPLYVRARKKSDRILCRGMEGTKKVSRLFIDRKVPKHERDSWPLLVDKNEQVLWVPLLHRSKIASVGKETKRKLVVSCSRLEESARQL